MSELTAKTCIKCGRTIENNKEIAHEVVNQNWVRLGYVCDDCIDTYPKEDIKDPDIEGERITIPYKVEPEPISLEEARLRKVESVLTAVCDLVVNCMGDNNFYCETRRCKHDEYDAECPFGQMRDYRDNMNELRSMWVNR